jgi:hypothetical protein
VLGAKLSARRAPRLGARALSRAIIWPRPTSPVGRVYVADPCAVGRESFSNVAGDQIGGRHVTCDAASAESLQQGEGPDLAVDRLGALVESS